MSAVQQLLVSSGQPLIVCDSADFDGTNDYMTRGATLTGAADSKSGIFSVFVRVDGNPGETRILQSATTLAGATSRFRIRIVTGGNVQVRGVNAAGVEILNLTGGTFGAGATWRHILSSWDLATVGARSLWVDGVDVTNQVTFTDDTIDYTVADWAVGAAADGTLKWDGCIAELYFAPGQYLDFSQMFNRLKFISGSGKPVFLGATGSMPTGTAPLVYQHLADAEAVVNFATNRGTGGDFAITGTLDTGSTSPSD